MFKDYYQILGISPNASIEEIKSAYKHMSKKWHPDKNPGKDTTTAMQDINEAYAILKDSNTRLRYDTEYTRYKEWEQAKSQESNHSQDKTYTHEKDSEYDVSDEKLKKDIYEAREYAKNLVDDFLSAFRQASKDAVKGAWENTKCYIYGGLIFSIIILITQTCQ